MDSDSLLEFYQTRHFNPVPIALDTDEKWQLQLAKRRNLYQRHLGIPLALLKGQPVIEFGCNSGENALVLAHAGARLTLVEPNDQVLPRLRTLFEHFHLGRQITALHNQDLNSFSSSETYSLVVAEGFLYTLPNREELLGKLVRLITPGGLMTMTFNDRYGGFIELTKRLVLFRACELGGIDPESPESLALAERLFGEDLAKVNASRPLEAWWKDMLVCPFYSAAYLWSYLELFPLFDQLGCGIHSTSPRWSLLDHYRWYKDVARTRAEHHQALLAEFRRAFPFFLTGRPSSGGPASETVIGAVAALTDQISAYSIGAASARDITQVSYPQPLEDYLCTSADPTLRALGDDFGAVYRALAGSNLQELAGAYQAADCLRSHWGTPCHYISAVRHPIGESAWDG